MKRFLSVFLVVLVLLTYFSVSAFAADSLVCPECGGTLKTTGGKLVGNGVDIYLCTSCNYSFVNGTLWGLPFIRWGSQAPVSSGAGNLEKPKKYYTAPSSGSGGSVSNSYTYNGGSTSYYSVMNTSNKTLNYTTYNQTTNNYTTNNYTYNNYTYNNEYNYYTYNIENKNYYVTNNITYVTVLYPDGTQDENGNDNYDHVNIYYELPDGRNSYNVKAEDVWGTYLTYNVTGAEKVLEDDGQTLGLWHLDGNLSDSSANDGAYLFSSTASSFVDVEGEAPGFDKALSGSSLSCTIDRLSSLSAYTLEFRMYVAGSYNGRITIPMNYSYTYTALKDRSGRQFYFDNKFTKTTQTDTFSVFLYVTPNQWNTVSLVFSNNNFSVFVNGQLSSFERFDNHKELLHLYRVETGASPSYAYLKDGEFSVSERFFSFTDTFIINNGSAHTVDEVRLSNKVLYTGNYIYSQQPFDTNSVLVKPENPLENDIVIMSNVPVSDYRIGGVRPTYPVKGSAYIYLENDVVKSVQQYQGDGWNAVDAFIYHDGAWVDLKNFNMKDLEFVEPEKPTPSPSPSPSPNPGDDTCKHEYKATISKEPTCTEKGIVLYTCSLCGKSYTENTKALGHDWQVVEVVSPQPSISPLPSASPDLSSIPPDSSSAPAPTEAPAEPAYTLYRCSRCGEEYKDYDGSGPPAPPADDEDGGIWGWIKKLVKSIVDGILGVLEEVVGGIIDFLVKLVDDFFEGVKSVVHNLIESLKQIADFGGEFKGFLGSVFSFLPPEIVVLFSFILSLAIVLAIIKFIRG